VGIAFIPHLGIEDDEAFFGTAPYQPYGGLYYYHIGRFQLPLMLMSYLGTLKTWIYQPLFYLVGIGKLSLRFPALLAGTATIWLFYRLLCRLAGERAAAIGSGLLALDATYLLTTCFDWGPVALQHLLLLGGVLLLLRFWEEGNERALAGGFFLFGLALWDKALAVWILGGLGIAALVTIPRQVTRAVTVRRLGVATLALALGALPLILYNIHTRGEGTFRGSAVYDASHIPEKTQALLQTFYGTALLGWMQAEDWQTPHPHQPHGTLQQISARLAPFRKPHQRSLLFYAFCAALLLAPLSRGRDLRAILFALIAMAVAWLQMAFTAKAGGAAHHTILLWPLPHLVIAISFASASRRLGRAGIPALAALVGLIMASELAVLNENYAQMVRDGGAIAWTDAIFPLTNYLESARARYVYSLDWGFIDTLRLLSQNKLPMRVGSDELVQRAWTAQDRQLVLERISHPDDLFVAHTRDFEYYPGLSAKLTHFAETAGYQRQTTVISDSYGRPTFEVYRFVPTGHSGPN
jgi:4-amino-4-deoxy-L-arabinose transferase-like glycosyltransferase